MYEQYYGLTDRPFALTPDPRFWFDTATHKKAMAYLGYGLSQGEGFIVISGDVGAGKTTLVGHLTDGIDPDRLNVIRIVSTQIAADDLLRTVCAGLDVDATGLSKAAMLSAIERGLHVVARGGRRTLLIVDEAQALPVDSLEELRMLSNFQAGGHAMLQIFLLGQPEFRQKLADAALEQLRQRVIAMHHLGPMEADELEPYLIHRLSVAGWDGRPRFKTDALATIYAWTGGIPRRVNVLMGRVLLHGAVEGIETFTAADIDAVATDLAGDGMTGATDRASEPELEPAAEPTPTLELVPKLAEPTSDGRPIVSEPLWEEVEAEPIVAEAEEPVSETEAEPADEIEDAPVADPEPQPEPEPVAVPVPEPVQATRPAEISAPPRLFDRVKLLGRRPILAAVDPAPAEPEDTPEAQDGGSSIFEWPLRENAPTREAEPAQAPVEVEEPAPAPAPVADLDLARRLAAIDRRMEEQDEALRRVLTLLVDWVERDGDRGTAPDLRGRLG